MIKIYHLLNGSLVMKGCLIEGSIYYIKFVLNKCTLKCIINTTLMNQYSHYIILKILVIMSSLRIYNLKIFKILFKFLG